MIQIYSPGNNNYIKNGNAVLLPLQCIVHAELNGAWTMEITHPLDEEGRWKLIEVGAVIKAPSFNGSQLFRIRQTQKQDSGITATAEPIFLDAVGDCFLLDVRPTKKTGQEALDMILANNSKYSGISDITTKATAYYIRKNALEAIAGEDNSFIERWGGEIIYNNHEIIINERAGGDYGMQILYGKNIPTDGLIESVDMEGVATRIIPKAYNGYILPGNAPWVDSPLINSYPTVMTKVVEYDNIRLAADVDEEEEDLIICNNMQELYTALRKAATDEFALGIDKPTVGIEVQLVILARSPDYQDFKELERVSLGDTVHCKHNRLGIVTDARVIALDYDCIQDEVQAITIGETEPSFLDRVSSTVQRAEKAITKAGAVKAEQIEGFINGALAQLRLQNTVAKKQDVRAVMFEDLDPESPTYGALAIGTQGWQISKERNADDTDWVWSTAATSGGIIADYITAGTLEAIDINGVNITGSTISGTNITGSSLVVQGPDDDDPTKYDDRITIADGYIDYETVYKGTEITPPKSVDARQGAEKLSFSWQDSSTVYNASYGYDGAVLYASGTPGRERQYLKSPQLYATRRAGASSPEVTVWKNIFVYGETYSPGGAAIFPGHITNSSKAIDFYVPLPASAVGLSCEMPALPTNLSVRGVNGYINSKQYLSDTDISKITISVRDGGLLIRFASSSTFTNCTNNTPVSVHGTFTFNFN